MIGTRTHRLARGAAALAIALPGAAHARVIPSGSGAPGLDLSKPIRVDRVGSFACLTLHALVKAADQNGRAPAGRCFYLPSRMDVHWTGKAAPVAFPKIAALYAALGKPPPPPDTTTTAIRVRGAVAGLGNIPVWAWAQGFVNVQ